VLDRRGERLFSCGDTLFSRIAAQAGLAFGVFPELRITHLIWAGRLHQSYLLRLVHDSSLSDGVLAHTLDGTQPERTDLAWFVHLLLHGTRKGLFSMRCRWAEARGQDSAARFIAANRISPGKEFTEGARRTSSLSGLQPSLFPTNHLSLLTTGEPNELVAQIVLRRLVIPSDFVRSKALRCKAFGGTAHFTDCPFY
jgi:hypothetical protein